jgi:PAS domain S-box-containing protein
MTLEEALIIAAQALFLWVATSTLIVWLHRRDRTRGDVFFVFLCLVIAVFAQQAAIIFPRLAPIARPLLYIALIAQPYFVLRIARYTFAVPAIVQRAVEIGLVLAGASLFLLAAFPAVVTILVFVYFLLVESYATAVLIQGARSIAGINRKRLWLAAAGSATLVILFLVALGLFLVDRSLFNSNAGAPLLRALLRFLAIISGTSYFLGFTPPRWLRRAWQLEELQDFLHGLSGNGKQPTGALEQLPAAAVRAVAGAGAIIARSSPDGRSLSLEHPGQPPAIINDAMSGKGDIQIAWKDRRPAVLRLPGELEPAAAAWTAPLKAQSLYITPIIGATRAWGLLMVALRHVPLFVEDDLALIQLFALQSVIHLERAALVERLEATNQELQERVAEQSRSESTFRALLESAPDGMVIIDTDRTIIMSNAQAGRHFGCQPVELAGRQLDSLFSEESRRHFLSSYQAVMQEPPSRPVIIAEEMTALRGDGSHILVEVSLNPIHSEEGMLTIVAVHDLTHRFQAEKKFRGLLESAPDSVVVVDEQGIIQLVNSQAEKMFGYERQEMLGKTIEMLVPRRFQKKHAKHREGYYGDHPARPMGAGLELFAVRRNGTEFPVEISLSPLEFEEGLLVSAAIRDITERKEFEEAIQQLNSDLEQRAAQQEASNKELESFSYSVSHDLRAPLRSIDGFSQALLEDYGSQLPKEALGYLKRVRAAAQRMAELIDDLLNLSRVTRASLNPRFINLSQLAQEVIAGLEEQNPQRKVQVSIMPDLMVTADPHLMRIVLDNLLSNAFKFTTRRDPALIEFGQLSKAAERTFFVRDNGVGFNMAYVDKLFGVFQRLHSASDYPGTGVGLATVQRIIKIHGGRIWPESTEGRGTTFFFTL